MPDKLHVYQIGDDFKVTQSDKKTLVFKIEYKKLSTRPDYKFFNPDGEIVGWVRGDELLASQFHLLDQDEVKIGQLQMNRVSNLENNMEISFRDKQYRIVDYSKGKSIDVKDIDGNIIFTIDKKILHISDSYLVHLYSPTERFLPASICIILDVLFHS